MFIFCAWFYRILNVDNARAESPKAPSPGCRFACPGLGAVALSGRAGVHYWMQNYAEKIHGFRTPI